MKALLTLGFLFLSAAFLNAQHLELQKIDGKRNIKLKPKRQVTLINKDGEKLEGKIIVFDQDSIGIETGFVKKDITKWGIDEVIALKKKTFLGYTAQTGAILLGSAIAVTVTGLIFPNTIGFDDFIIGSAAALYTWGDLGEETFHISEKYQIEFVE
jgi:hypothetical protein